MSSRALCLADSMARCARWVLALALLGVPSSARAAPVEDDIELLRRRPTGMEEDEWRKQRREVAKRLGEVRSPKAVDALIEVVEKERYDAVLSVAIEGLAKQGDPRAIPALQRVYADRSLDRFVRQQAGDAIVELGGTPSDEPLAAPGPAARGGTGRLGGPQLGTMGAASVGDEELDVDLSSDRPLPDDLVARTRSFGIALGRLDLDVDTRVSQQPILADGGLGAYARYVDERSRWGWTVRANLDSRVANGDYGDAADDADVLLVRQGLDAVGEAHLYFGKTDVHGFAELGVSERVTHVRLDNQGGGNQSSLTDTRFALDVIPAAGFGWGRLLDGASEVMVDAIVEALTRENILAKPLEPEARRAIRDAVYRRSNTFSAYPRTAAVLTVLQDGGYLARPPSVRLTHRIRSIVEDPSYVNRPRGYRVRAGFLYDAPIAQDDFLRRGDAIGAPFLQFEAGVPLSLERQVEADVRFWFDVLGEPEFTADAGFTYTRFFHTRYDDYVGQWFAGSRAGISRRSYGDLPDDLDIRPGYRAVGQTGYAYGFRRGSELRVGLEAGADSGGFVAGLNLALRIGIARGSVLNLDRTASSAAPTNRGGSSTAGAAKASAGSESPPNP